MTSRQRRRQRRRGGVRSKLLFAAAGLLAVVAAAVFVVGSWVLHVAADASLSDCKPVDHRGNSVLLAADGSRLGYVQSDIARQPVSIDRMPRDLEFATVAIEDKRFFQHGGIDYEGIARAAWQDVQAGSFRQGGSTITQQLVRNLCIPDAKRNIKRKIIEASLANQYAQKHSKKEILGQYLNIASYGTINGSTAIGAGAAASFYFSKPVSKLTLDQSALLAGLPQAPTDYNPILNPRGALERRNQVLEQMVKLGYISKERALEAEQQGLGLNLSDGYFKRREPYFFDYVENILIHSYGVNAVRRGGLRVYTTIDPNYQTVGRDAIDSALPYSTDPSAALVAIDPRTGFIRGMASSGSYDSNKYNLAAQGHRQPGSTFKMLVLTTAIKQGIDPYNTYYTSKPLNLDLPQWGHWEVHTADEGYLGTVNLQQATVNSDNTVFAQLDLDVGPENVAATAKSMGVTTKLDGIPAEGLGGLRIGVSPLEMADAFATLASGGIHRNPIAIRKVEFPSGKVGHPESADPKRVLPENVAYEVTRILHDNITGGTGTAAYTGCYGQAGKTGTTDNYVDAWFDGYQPNLATSVWVGYPQSNDVEMTSVHGITVFGGTFPAEIWNSFYSGIGIPCKYFQVPAEAITWSPFFGSYTASAPSPGKPSSGAAGKGGGEGAGGGGYDSGAYAPGAGTQEPVPVPAPAPTPGAGVGGGSPTGGLGGGN
jgi:penicillin-binding protein 1A